VIDVSAPEESEDAEVVLAAAPGGGRDYTLITFEKFVKRESVGGPQSSSTRSSSMKQLRVAMADKTLKTEPRARAKAALIERFAVALQSFALAFIGLPLAVWVRPSGKSVGVIIAFILIMIYHWLLRTGFTMVESGGSAGIFVMFLPNILFVSGGFLLWGKALRS